MTTNKLAQRGELTIDTYLTREPVLTRIEVAADAIADILHACCQGDEIQAEDLLRMGRSHFISECEEETKNETWDEDAECNACSEVVTPEGPYFTTPCGTYCQEHMFEHVKTCGVCASEFPEMVEDPESKG